MTHNDNLSSGSHASDNAEIISALNRLVSAGCVVYGENGVPLFNCAGCRHVCPGTADIVQRADNEAPESADTANHTDKGQIDRYIESIQARRILGINRSKPYPYDKEKKLTYAIVSGDTEGARMYLNEILGHILFASADSLNAIKARAMQLTTVISRAAIESGADIDRIYRLGPESAIALFECRNVGEICEMLTELLRTFTDEVLKPADLKHLESITRVISYINNNYMHKITLDDVAAHVFLSPSYLSRIFREEMQQPFSTYLNQVRVDKSKVLLLSSSLPVSEIAEMTGFYDQSYFNKVFKRMVGITPKKYRDSRGAEPDTPGNRTA